MREIKFLLKNFVAAIFALIIFSATAEAWQPEIRIGILSGVKSVELQLSAPSVMIDAATQKSIKKIRANENFTVDFAALKANAVEIRGEKIPLENLQVTINGKKYFGGVRINKAGGNLTVINLVAVEEYLRGVVPKEMSISFPTEALKAQAVAARTFTLKNRNRHKSDGYDLCATNHCQFYNGAASEKISDEIIAETRGEIVVLKGNIVDTNFHTDSGGMTESVLEVWGVGAAHLQAVDELETKTQPWTVEFTAKEISARMGAAFGDLKSVKLSKLTIGKSAADRSKSGRVKFAELVGSKKTVRLSGNELRTKFSLPSTLFDVKFKNGAVVFEGYGYGHGVGMSQNGARAYAQAGWDYKKILAHYYRGTDLKKLY